MSYTYRRYRRRPRYGRRPRRYYRRGGRRYVRPMRRYTPKRMLPLTGLPNSKLVRLRYTENLALNPGAAAMVEYEWRANSIYDPNYTGTGHQPAGAVELRPWYDHFTVLSSWIKMVPVFEGNAAPDTNGAFGIILSDQTGQATSLWGTGHGGIAAIIESRRGRGAYNLVKLDTQNQVKRSAVFKRYNARRFFGYSVVGHDNHQGKLGAWGTGANPDEDVLFSCWYSCINTGNPAALNFLFILEYVCLLTEPKHIDPGSTFT